MTMRAMQLDAPGRPLRMVERDLPAPGEGEIRVAVSACGVCRTDRLRAGAVEGVLVPVP